MKRSVLTVVVVFAWPLVMLNPSSATADTVYPAGYLMSITDLGVTVTVPVPGGATRDVR